MTPESLANFISNNYASDNYYVADHDVASNSAGSIDGFGLDDIDEIDTNNMAIYSGVPIKKENRAEAGMHKGASGMKKESVDSGEVIKLDQASAQQKASRKVLTTATNSKSLLLPSNTDIGNVQGAVDADIMLNVMGQLDQGSSGSSENGNKVTAAQNSVYDETSQVRVVIYV